MPLSKLLMPIVLITPFDGALPSPSSFRHWPLSTNDDGRRIGPVDEVQIEVFDLELFHRFLHRWRFFISANLIPQLGVTKISSRLMPLSVIA